MNRVSPFGRAAGVALVLVGILAPGDLLGQSLITGMVTDSNRVPIGDAVVFAQSDSTVRTTSNAEGTFSIEVEPGDAVVIEALGYGRQKVDVGNSDRIDVVLMRHR